MNKSVNACTAKYFGVPQMTRKEAVKVLNAMLVISPREIRRMRKAGELPACLKLIAEAMLRDIKTGRMDTVTSILDAVFNCKTGGTSKTGE
jgi:hypothetical protein